MNKFKLVSFWVFVTAALGFGIFGYFQLKNNHKPQTDALQALPDSCLVYLRSASVHELENSINERNLIADKLRLFDGFTEVFTALHLADSLLNGNELLAEEFGSSSFHIAMYPNANWLIGASIKQLGQQEACAEALLSVLHGAQEGAYFRFKFSSFSCIALFQDGALLLSNNAKLLKLCESNGAKLSNNGGFKKFYSTLTENKLLSIYCNQSLLHSEKKKAAFALDLFISKGYFSAAIDVEPSELRMNGYQWVDTSAYMHSLLEQKACNTEDLLSSLPFDTQWFTAYGITNLFQLPEANEGLNNAYWNNIQTKALYNVKLQWKEYSGRLLARCGTYGEKQVLVCGSNDTLQTDEALQMMADSVWTNAGVKIHRLSADAGLQLFEPYLSDAVNYAARVADNIYYSNDLGELNSTVAACSIGRYLVLNEDFLHYMQSNVPDKFHFLLYNAPSQEEHLKLDFIRLAEKKDSKPFENFRHLSYSLLAEGDYFKCRFHLKHESGSKEKQVLWTTVLDTTCSSKAYGFINHTTNEHEILVQDDKFQLYLINAKGAILWKKALDEKIISSIHSVDIYKNGKFQILFNTETKIHLLDRNGEKLPNFPIFLPSPASAELSVFDYDNTRDYRILIPCSNKVIYNYTLAGKKSDGFATVRSEELVKLPIQYVSVGESQYLVALDVEGKIYTFSRKGVGRIGLRNRSTVNCANFYVDASNSPASTQLMYFDESTGNLNKISFSDSKSIVKFAGDFTAAKAKYLLVDENRSVDVLMHAEGSVRAYDVAGNLLFEKNLPELPVDCDYMAGDSFSILTAFSAEGQKIYCYDLLHNKEMRINASAPALIDDLFKDNKQYLIVPNASELSCVPVR